ncbi:tetratricopeptide repeat protein [Sphingopyxis panaciterrae]
MANPEYLSALEASLHLRITPELLHNYVIYGAKGRGGRKLPTVEGGTTVRFRTDDLDAYDNYLREPWPSPEGRRASVPQGIKDYLKIEAGGLCARCDEGAPLSDAHIVEWEVSQSHHHHNLLRLCDNCHGLYDRKAISREEIERLKNEAIERVQRRVARSRVPAWPIAAAPPLTPSLFGRDDEAAEVTAALRAGESLCICGVGGIGKTQLALHALRDAALSRPIVWIGVDALGSVSTIADALRAQAAAAGIEVSNGRALLGEARACIVFDGIERLGQGGQRDEIADFIEGLLLEQSDTLILVTSQTSLPGLHFDRELRLGPLGQEASLGLIADRHDELPSSDVERLLRFADGHPLTLRIISALIQHFGSPGVVADRLEERGAAAVAMPRRQTQSEKTSLTHCLDLAFSELGIGEKRLLWIVAVSPGGFRPGFFDLDELVGGDAFDAATELAAWNLIDMVADEEFEPMFPARVVIAALSPIRAYLDAAIRQAPFEGFDELEIGFYEYVALLARFIDMSYLRGGDIEIGRALMERELPNAVQAFDVASTRAGANPRFAEIIDAVANATMMTFFTSGRFETGQAIMRRASEVAAENGSLGDAIQFLHQMQTLAERAANRDAAAFALAEAEKIAGDAKGEPLAQLRLLQASSAEVTGDFSGAEALARESYDIFEQSTGPDRDWIQSAAFQLARALEFGGKPDQALPFYRRALEWAEAKNDPINSGSILHHIGNCEAYAGKWQSAMHAYRQAAEHFVALEAVEFISNALGEAGLILPELDPLIGLPRRDVIAAGLADIAAQFEPHFSGAPGRSAYVSFRKLKGLVALALHSGNRDLLAATGAALYADYLRPREASIGSAPPHVKAVFFNLGGVVRLLQFLSSGTEHERPLTASELFILCQLTCRAFTTSAADLLASYLRRRCDMFGLTGATLVRIMQFDENEPVVCEAMAEAAKDGVDLMEFR